MDPILQTALYNKIEVDVIQSILKTVEADNNGNHRKEYRASYFQEDGKIRIVKSEAYTIFMVAIELLNWRPGFIKRIGEKSDPLLKVKANILVDERFSAGEFLCHFEDVGRVLLLFPPIRVVVHMNKSLEMQFKFNPEIPEEQKEKEILYTFYGMKYRWVDA